MIFVPLPLFATFALLGVLLYMLRTRDMGVRANQMFAALVALYTVQSLLLCLRWGYGMEGLRLWIGLLAPVLPVIAYFAYLSLANRLSAAMLWPLAIVALNWGLLLFAPDLADPAILLTFATFGTIILRNTWSDLGLVRIGQTDGALRAMQITGAALICSALGDLYALVDFITTGGQNIAFVVTWLQTGFLLIIGVVAMAGEAGPTTESQPQIETAPQEEDHAIMARLDRLFEQDALHLDTELNLRRISRRLGVPDRSVSQAINRTQGKSVSQYVNAFRIKDACQMLRDTDQSILQISLAAGFLTKSNFNREFTRVTGQTPSGWRKAHL